MASLYGSEASPDCVCVWCCRPPFDAKNHLSLAVKINAGKFARIPDTYSEDLYRAIRWMLSIEVRGARVVAVCVRLQGRQRVCVCVDESFCEEERKSERV